VGGNVGRSPHELMIRVPDPGAAVARWLVVGVEQATRSRPHRSWLPSNAAFWDHPHPRPLDATNARQLPLDQALVAWNRCESRTSTPTIPISWPTPPVGPGPTGSLPAGAQQFAAGLTPWMLVEEGVVHGQKRRPAASRPIALQLPGSHNRQNMLMAAAVGLETRQLRPA